MEVQERILYVFLIIILAALIVTGFIHQGFTSTIDGLLRIQQHPSRLINDFTVVGGTGAALVNAALTAALGLLLVGITRVRLSGPTIAAVFTILGFGLFGKTPLNVLPIIIGVFLSGKIVGKTFSEYLLIALFGTALGPAVTFMIFEFGLSGLPAIFVGTMVGIVTGMVLPPAAIAMLHLHQGYNLYNMGLTCGFFGLFVASIIAATRRSIKIEVIWNSEPPFLLVILIPVLAACFLVAGTILGKKKAYSDFVSIQKLPGRLPSDFMDMVSSAGSLVNMGLLGLGSWLYVFVVKADFNGPVLGGILTVIGFGAFGKHLKNVWPVMGGVILSCLVFGKNLSAPGPILATLFVMTLAPIAGQFGPFAGIIAGFLHLVLVERTAAWHGGMDLYNNGFAGGLTAALLVSVIEWYKSNRSDKLERKGKSKKVEVK